MRNAVFIFLAIMFVCVACEKTLSCDPYLNEWANTNLSYFESADRDEFVQLPLSRQRAIYAGLSGEKKVALWKNKMQLVKQSGELSEEEFEMYSRLFDFLEPWHYDSYKGRVVMNAYADRWKKQMEERYSWDEEKFFIYTYTWMTLLEFQSAMMYDDLLTKAGAGSLPGMTLECNCIYSIYCKTSGLGSICSSSPECKQGAEDCGIVGNSNCTGTCQ